VILCKRRAGTGKTPVYAVICACSWFPGFLMSMSFIGKPGIQERENGFRGHQETSNRVLWRFFLLGAFRIQNPIHPAYPVNCASRLSRITNEQFGLDSTRARSVIVMLSIRFCCQSEPAEKRLMTFTLTKAVERRNSLASHSFGAKRRCICSSVVMR
jgi:hypothetical protein